MSNNTLTISQDVINFIQTIKELSEEEKSQYIEMINKGEDPREVLDKIEENIQNQIMNDFKEAGVVIDENDPEYQAAFKKMIGEIAAAEDKYNKEMDAIEKEANQIREDTGKEIDHLKAQAIKDQIMGGKKEE